MLDLSAAFASFPVQETARLRLREMTPDHIAVIFQTMADPAVVRYFGLPPMASLEEAAQRVARVRQAFAEQSGVRWAITRREDGQLLGSGGFWRIIKPHHRAELGYELAPRGGGRG